MPFELLGWRLIDKHGVSEANALALLSDAGKLPAHYSGCCASMAYRPTR
jgi:hypothetical protein